MIPERYRARQLVMQDLVRRACEATGVSRNDLVGPSRQQCICQVRFAIMLIARRKGLSLNQIGGGLDWRDHSTVLHGLRRGSELLNDPGFAELVREIEAPEMEAA